MKDYSRTDAQLLEELQQLRRKAQLSEAVAEEFLRTRKALEDERVFIADALNSLMDIFYVSYGLMKRTCQGLAILTLIDIRSN